jgi:uncharacterized protein YcfJ
MKFKVLAIAALALALISGKAEKAQADDSQIFGTVIGAATGGFLGSNIGSGDGRLAATAAGTLIGAVIGSNMAQASDYRPYGSRYDVRYPRPEPVYAQPKPRRQVVIVKHVYPEGYSQKRYRKHQKKQYKRWRKHKREQYRRRLARTCYENPRRCSEAF